MEYPEDSVQSQYASSPTIRLLVDSFNKQIDPQNDITLFYDKVFNLSTAEGIGLDIWGRILGIDRLLSVESDNSFGFEGSELEPFDQDVFYTQSVSNNFRLEDTPYRQLLFYKASSNIASSDLATLNTMLNSMFKKRGAYIVESSVMCIRFYFQFYLSPYEKALMQLEFVPPRPAGVGYEWLEVIPDETFGFNGSNLQVFNQGIFTQGVTSPIKGT